MLKLNNDIVTIITVVFNGSKVIEKTIQSVINQSYKKIQYIIIDGGSDDGTVDIIRKYESNIHFWLSERDHGVYDAMNKGLNIASGKWVNFMNAGDYFFSDDTLSDLFSAEADYEKFGLIYGDAEFRTDSLSYIIQASEECSTNEFMPFSHQAAFFRNNIINELKFDTKYRIAADADLCLRMLKNGCLFKHVPVTICSYNAQHGLSMENDIIRTKELIAIQACLNGIDPDSRYFRSSIRKAYVRQLIKMMIPSFFWNRLRANKIRRSLLSK